MRGSKAKKIAGRGALRYADYEVKPAGKKWINGQLFVTYQYRLDPFCGRAMYKQAKKQAKMRA
jgi:hypothetical protein